MRHVLKAAAALILPALMMGAAGTPPAVHAYPRLDWRVLHEAELIEGYRGTIVPADWDGDGLAELLLPRAGGPGFLDEYVDQRSAILELDGSLKETGLVGDLVRSRAAAWDFDNNGKPDVVSDSRGRAQYVYDAWYNALEAELAKQLDSALAPLRQRQEQIARELERLRGSGDYKRIAELRAEDDELYDQIDAVRFDDKYKPTRHPENGISFHLQPDTSVYALDGRVLKRLPGRNLPAGQILLGDFHSTAGTELLLVPEHLDGQQGPSRERPELVVYSAHGRRLTGYLEPARLSWLVAGDFDGEGYHELAGVRLIGPDRSYKGNTYETCVFDPQQPDGLEVVSQQLAEPPGAWPAGCVDWDGDGTDELILANGTVLNMATGASRMLEHPPLASADFLECTSAPRMVLLDYDGLGHPELWAVVGRTNLAAFSFDGQLLYYENMRQRVLQLAVLEDGSGKAYLVVQLRDRIIAWRQEKSEPPTSVMALAGMGR